MSFVPATEYPESIAVVGMAARLPGAPDIDHYWANIREGAESIVKHSREEMLANGARPDVVDDPYYVNASAPVEGAECFDAAFFGYSAREAALMDPQHRIFLETAYQALEDAGHQSRYFDGQIGVFAGCTMNTYLLYNVMPHANDVLSLVGDLQTMVGNDKEYLPTRVSYKLDLRGPSVGIQTACSSSLVAVHFACRSLLDGESDMALAGGSSLRMPHAAGYLSTPGGTSSPDGHCRSFDADSAGSVVGSGAGVVVLRRLADALRDGDQIHAVIRGSAVNNDGAAKASFTAPSADGQDRAIAQALVRAGVSARDIDLVEAHGTATPLGDPIEVAALTRAFRRYTDDTEYCWLGSVKANIGHLDAAAGVAGLIKVVLALKNRRVPPMVNFRRPNPQLDLPSTPFRVPVESLRFDGDADRPLLASVNSLAMGGTNAHVVVESPPRVEAPVPTRRRRERVLLSARSAEALEEQSRALGRWVREHPLADPGDIAYTLAVGRRSWEFRRVVDAVDLEDLGYALTATGSRHRRDSGPSRPPRVAYLLPGQGAQRVGMGSRLRAQDPVFDEQLRHQIDLFRKHGDLDLEPYLLAPAEDEAEAALREDLNRTDLTQPLLFAVETALARTLGEHGVEPYAMLGHSVGELVAAGLAGVFSEADGVRLITERGRAMAATEPGAMLWAQLAPGALPDDLGDAVSVAAWNGPDLVSVAGPVESIEALAERWTAEHVVHGRLHVTRAFHSALMDPAVAAVAAVAAELSLAPPSRPVLSNVTGRYLTAEQATDPEYWAQQVRQPVRFADGIEALLRDGVTSFVELGPGTSLSRFAHASGATTVRPVLHDETGAEAESLDDLLVEHWLDGGSVDWSVGYRSDRRSRLSLPGYPFARTRHWMEPATYPSGTAAPAAPVPAVVDAAPAAPAAAHRVDRSSATVASPPPTGTANERYLRVLWRRLLGSDDFTDDQSFFEVGGHSLLAMQMITALRRDGIDVLELTTFFERPSLREVAALFDERGVVAPAASGEETGGGDGGGAATALGAANPGPGEEAAPDRSGSQAAAMPVDDADLIAEIAGLSDDEVRERLRLLEEGRS